MPALMPSASIASIASAPHAWHRVQGCVAEGLQGVGLQSCARSLPGNWRASSPSTISTQAFIERSHQAAHRFLDGPVEVPRD